MRTTKLDMEKYLDVMLDSPLFEGLTREDLEKILDCLHGAVQEYSRGEIIYHEGEKVTKIGLILEGFVDMVQEDAWGNRMLLGRFRAGQVFADSFVLAGDDSLPFTSTSVRKTVVLMMPYAGILSPCASVCACHTQLMANLLSISAKKNISLLRKINHITQHSVREKLQAYLSAEARKKGSNHFTIQYNRQGLANYLAIDRSTLSAELSKMQQEGLLTYNKNTFTLQA